MTRRAAMLMLVLVGLGSLCFGQAAPEPLPGQEIVPDFNALIPAHDPVLEPTPIQLERVTAGVPWPRGLVFVDGDLVVLARGRHRGNGGVGQDVEDEAGTLYRIDLSIFEPVVKDQPAGERVRNNATVLARPSNPPFRSYDRADPPEGDTMMTRPYCGLAFDPVSRNLFVCAFAGAELSNPTRFRKHATDAVFRYDLRTSVWSIVEQHDHTVVPAEALGSVIPNTYYPHHDPTTNPPPHGWLNGVNGCAVVGDYLYAVAKDNHVVVAYPLSEIRNNPTAGPPAGRVVISRSVTLKHPGGQMQTDLLGTCAVASHGGYLYVGYRTSSVVVRFPIDETGMVLPNSPAELIAVFEPWNRETRRSGDMFDIAFSPSGEMFVSMSRNGRVWRIGKPDPARPFNANDALDRPTTAPPFVDLTPLLGKRLTASNIAVSADNYLYVCTRANDRGEGNIFGTIYRVKLD